MQPPGPITDAVEFARKRVDRARQREAEAARESRLALSALAIAESRLAAWVEANPDPQMGLL